MANHAVNGRRNFPALVRKFRRLLLQDRGHRVGGRISFKRPPAGKHFVENCPQRKDVGAPVGGLASHLLRRHITHRPQHHARLSLQGRVRRERWRLHLVEVRDVPLRELRQTEIKNLHAAVGDQKNIRGFQVAMDDSPHVRRGHAVRRLRGHLESFAERQRTGAQPLMQGFAFEQFGDQEGRALVRPGVVNRQDIRMVQRRDSASFLLEARQAFHVASPRFRQDFQRNVAAEARIAGAIHFPHPARTERRKDFVRTQFSAGGQDHRSSSLSATPVQPARSSRAWNVG